MLNNKTKLFFPKIEFDKSVELNHNSGDTKIVNLYYMDWSHKEKKCNNGESELPFRYEEIIKNLKFAISDSYLDEIRRASWASISELNTIRKLDSSIKQIYLKPTVAYISTAFTLLSDSVFDTETNFYYRGNHKVILTNLLLYKFWKNQRHIPASMILDFAHIPELLTISMNETMTEQQAESLNEFLSFVNEDMNNK